MKPSTHPFLTLDPGIFKGIATQNGTSVCALALAVRFWWRSLVFVWCFLGCFSFGVLPLVSFGFFLWCFSWCLTCFQHGIVFGGFSCDFSLLSIYFGTNDFLFF